MIRCILIILLVSGLTACQTNRSGEVQQDGWVSLWNGKDLAGWHSYLGTPFDQHVDSLGRKLEPFGVDNDPLHVFSVVPSDSGNMIRVSGVAWGMIYTEQSFHNYHAKLRIKWGEAMHRPREKGPRDSGLLYHGFGEPGAGATYPWMASQELQIEEGDMGDYWPTGDVEIDVPSVLHDSLNYMYKEGAPMRRYYFAKISKVANRDSTARRWVIKGSNEEKPSGVWNDLDLIVYGDSSIHVVNGKVVMRLFHSRKGSTQQPLREGRLVIQSEGAEVFFKNIQIRPITGIPEAYKAK